MEKNTAQMSYTYVVARGATAIATAGISLTGFGAVSGLNTSRSVKWSEEKWDGGYLPCGQSACS